MPPGTGGDDYVTKPFSLDEVIARIRAVLRRSGSTPAAPAVRSSFADIEMDEDTPEVWKNGSLVALSPTEFNQLRYFLENAGRVLSKAQILDHVWRYDFGGDANVVESSSRSATPTRRRRSSGTSGGYDRS